MRFANMIPFVPSETLLRERDVAERPGDVRLRRPQRSGDIRTVRTRQGSNIEKRAIHRMTLFSISLRARDGIRTLPMSGKLIKSRRNAHCLKCVYRLSTTCKSEWKAVKGSAEQIHFTPLLLVVELLQSHHIRKRLIEQFLSINLLIIIYLFFKYYNLYRLGGRRLLSSSYLISSVSPLL